MHNYQLVNKRFKLLVIILLGQKVKKILIFTFLFYVFFFILEPMIDRIHLLDERIPIYFLHGEQSWITTEPSFIIQQKRKNVFVETIKDAGHHVCYFYLCVRYFLIQIFFRFMLIHP